MRVPASDREHDDWQLDRISNMADRTRSALTSFHLLNSQIEDDILFCVVLSKMAPKVRVNTFPYGVVAANIVAQKREGGFSAYSWDELSERISRFIRGGDLDIRLSEIERSWAA